MEIGSFIELQFPKGKEYYSQSDNIARLNTGRAAIWHALRITNCKTIWLPYYQCDSVREFLSKKNVHIKYYNIDSEFRPINLLPADDEAVLIVNYYGMMPQKRMKSIANRFKNVIIDNSQAFFCEPIESAMNVYSCRKFVGVPDGAYVIGKNAESFVDEYEQSYSSDTALFMLQRIEYGCEGKSYQSRQINEHRIDTEDCKKMSKLTQTILCGTDYEFIKQKRRENFLYACKLFGKINCINPESFADRDTIPMVYTLVIENDAALDKLQNAKHFQGHWWSYLLNEVPMDSFEYWISRYMLPITIDQRYGQEELDYIFKIIS